MSDFDQAIRAACGAVCGAMYGGACWVAGRTAAALAHLAAYATRACLAGVEVLFCRAWGLPRPVYALGGSR